MTEETLKQHIYNALTEKESYEDLTMYLTQYLSNESEDNTMKILDTSKEDIQVVIATIKENLQYFNNAVITDVEMCEQLNELQDTLSSISKPHFESVGSGLVLVDSGTNSSLHFRITAKLELLSRTKEYDYDEMVHIVNDVIDPNKNLPFNTYKNLATALSIILSKVKNEIHY